MSTTTIPATKLAELHAAIEAARLYTRFDGPAPNLAVNQQLIRAQSVLLVYLLEPLNITVEVSL